MTSLFLLSLPRSLSTFTFRVCRDVLGLRAPSWAGNGEVLNHDMFALGRWPRSADDAHKFVTKDADPERFARATEFLETVTRAEGRIYKDVVNPFVVAQWPGLSRLRVLKIRRDPSEVAFAMLQRGWHYPSVASPRAMTREQGLGGVVAGHYLWDRVLRRATRIRWHGRMTAVLRRDDVLRGILRADGVLAALPGESVDYADIVRDEEVLRRALRNLYPDVEIPALRYIDDRFRATSRQQEERRRSWQFRRVERRIEELRAEDGR